ncbi:MAG: Uma2 family endonuclease [Acidobacteriota bacterium]
MLPKLATLTDEEYLARERASENRTEYLDGELLAMAGASERHNLLVANLVRLLGNHFLDRECRVYPSDMRVHIEALGSFTYPDVSVVCGASQFHDERRDTLLNPEIIIEVLSPSTEAHDRGRKFHHYQHLDSLDTFILVTQDHPRIEIFQRRADGTWTYKEHHNLDDVASLTAIDFEIKLRDLYAKVL